MFGNYGRGKRMMKVPGIPAEPAPMVRPDVATGMPARPKMALRMKQPIDPLVATRRRSLFSSMSRKQF